MKANGARPMLAAGLMLFAPLWLVSCASPVESVSGCEAAFAELPALEPSQGLYVVVSEQLAMTLESCSDVAEWEGELRARPEVVGVSEIAEDDIHAYLAGSCNLLPDAGSGNEVCVEGRSSGYFR